MTGWDLVRASIVPKEYKVTPFKNMTWVNDALHGRSEGADAEKLAVVPI
jgi:hypothetical protein